MAINNRRYLTGAYTVSAFPTIPAGTYDATLEGVEDTEHDKWGERWVWYWTIAEMHPDGGDYELQVWTPPHFSSTGIASEQAKVLGATVTNGAKVILDDLRGGRAQLIVTLDEEKGRNRVQSVMPPAESPTRPAEGAVDPEYQAWKAEQEAEKAAAVDPQYQAWKAEQEAKKTTADAAEQPPIPPEPPTEETV